MNLEVTKGEIGKVVLSVTTGDYSSSERSVHVCDGNFGARDGCALLVTDSAANGCGCDLRARASSATKNKRENCEQRNDYPRIAKQFFCIQKSNLHSFTPRGNICAKEESTISARKTNCLGFTFSFTPLHIRERTQPLSTT